MGEVEEVAVVRNLRKLELANVVWYCVCACGFRLTYSVVWEYLGNSSVFDNILRVVRYFGLAMVLVSHNVRYRNPNLVVLVEPFQSFGPSQALNAQRVE